MAFGALRNIFRPLSRTLISRFPATPTTPFPPDFTSPKSLLLGGSAPFRQPQWLPILNHFHSLTDTRFPKRRPSDKPRRKRASLRPPGPYAWVQYVPGEPILPNRPNEGSVKRRNEKKRMRQRRAFILVNYVECTGFVHSQAERKKRKAQMQEAKRKKSIERVERKMAAVARERAWAERLAELKRIEEEKKASMA
ncbi:protein translocase subunit [Senna tora]|uniref:Protein translocase subunit n=1 Tax=Senna tora TaxID=362788 RepID=A0A834TYA1_9FABA|nr:protein translocase subunit [Senna tora]